MLKIGKILYCKKKTEIFKRSSKYNVKNAVKPGLKSQQR
jgi:hypothetical protein